MGKPVPDGSLPWTDRSQGVASEVIAIGKRQSGEAEDQTEEAGLDRSIPSRGWGLFLSLLEYKLRLSRRNIPLQTEKSHAFFPGGKGNEAIRQPYGHSVRPKP